MTKSKQKGDHARGHITIGRIAIGEKIIEVKDTSRLFIDITKEQVRSLIDSEYPNMFKWFRNIMTGMFR